MDGVFAFMKESILSYKSTTSTYVVHDKTNRNIIHIHQFSALPGNEISTKAEIESEALEIAQRITGKPLSEMGVMHVRTEDLQFGVEYEGVDLEKKCLIAKDQDRKKIKGSRRA